MRKPINAEDDRSRFVGHISTEGMMETAKNKYGMSFEAFSVDRELHFEATDKRGIKTGPMIETELYWYLSGYLQGKGIL